MLKKLLTVSLLAFSMVGFSYAADFQSILKQAQQGDVEAQTNLGLIYDKGVQGIMQDSKEAVKWYQQAADKGYALAQYNLGAMYYHGKGVEQSYTEAVKWWRLASVQGNIQARGDLGGMYALGLGVEKDIQKAIILSQSACDGGYQLACNNLRQLSHQYINQ